jgi:predicted histone-like DNA-binding protein
MSYRYKKIKKTVTVGKNPGDYYVVQVANEGTVTKEQVLEFIAKDGTTSASDMEIMFGAFVDAITENVNMGRGVKLGSIGTILPDLKTRTSATAEEVTADNIQKVVVNLRVNPDFRREMNDTKVKEATKYELKHVKQS